MTFGVQKDVAGLDVPMDKSLLMGEMKGVGHIGDDTDCFLDRWPFDLGKVLAFNQIGDDEQHPLMATNIVNRHDPRMSKPGNPPSFFQQIIIRSISSSGDLDGHQALKFLVESPVNLAMATFGDQPLDSVTVGQIFGSEDLGSSGGCLVAASSLTHANCLRAAIRCFKGSRSSGEPAQSSSAVRS